jgi:hypothetical protein
MLGKELSVEGSSQAVRGQVIKTTTQPQTSIEPRSAAAETKRPEQPQEQPTTQAEVPAMNTSALSYPVLRNRERSLHTCAQDVQITRMATI